MFSPSSVQTLFTNFSTDISTMLVYTLAILLGILAALLGLGFGIRRIKRWVTGSKA